MLLAAACSLDGEPRSVYRAGANRSATDLLAKVRLGQTVQGSFIVTLLIPVAPPIVPMLFPDDWDQNAPIERRLTIRLMEALAAARLAVEQTTSGDGNAFLKAVGSGVSANLCAALAQIVDCFPTLDVSVFWAQTQPVTKRQLTVPFGDADAPLLREAVRLFQEHAPRYDVSLHGYVRVLRRKEGEQDGTIRLNTLIDQKQQSVTALLERQDYERAVQAHKDKALVTLSGDLERMGQRWRLLNPHLKEVFRNEESDPEE